MTFADDQLCCTFQLLEVELILKRLTTLFWKNCLLIFYVEQRQRRRRRECFAAELNRKLISLDEAKEKLSKLKLILLLTSYQRILSIDIKSGLFTLCFSSLLSLSVVVAGVEEDRSKSGTQRGREDRG